jgi:hypothetical protein
VHVVSFVLACSSGRIVFSLRKEYDPAMIRAFPAFSRAAIDVFMNSNYPKFE